MDVKCPHCGTEYEVEQKDMYRHTECEVCGKGFVAGAVATSAASGRSGAAENAKTPWATKTTGAWSFGKSRSQSSRIPHEPLKEEVLLSVKPSMAPVVPIILLTAVPAFLISSAILCAAIGIAAVGAILLEIVGLVLICMVFRLYYSRMECIITNRRVIVKQGILTQCERQVHVMDMRDIFLRRGLFQQMTGTGSISIGSQTTGLSGRIIIPDVKEYQRVIETLERLKANGGNQP